ncbi:MFS transporter [Neorhodopirellula pilleata]|nr:hypothetical protein [Neorhodopirellula pilleata]
MLCLVGLVAGGFVGVPKLHHAWSLRQEPVELTCLALLQSGVPEQTSIVRLSDPVVHPPGEMELPGDEAAAMPGLAKMQALLADPRAKGLVDQLVRGDILPRGVPRRSGHQPLKLSMGRSTVASAQNEIDQNGTVTVHVSEDQTVQFIVKVASLLHLTLPETLAAQAELPAYTLHPVSLIGSRREALAWTIGGSLTLALGLVLCGSATLGWWVIFSPFAAIIGLPGIAFRNGRGNRITRRIGAALGVGFLVAAFYLAGSIGAIGQSGGQWLWHVAGWLAASIGLAALSGTWLNRRIDRVQGRSVDALVQFASPKKKQSKAKREADFNRQIASKPPQLQNILDASEYTRRYLDAKLSVSLSSETSGELAVQASSLEKMEFDAPLVIEHCAEDQLISATVQIGCRKLVMIVMEETAHGLKIRLTSILEDGHVILSSGGVEDRFNRDFSGDVATVHFFDSSNAAKLVTLHLERAASVAEQRQTKLVLLDPNEWRDLIHYSERCLAQTMHEQKLERWDVLDSHYGRFSFPPKAVLTPAMA